MTDGVHNGLFGPGIFGTGIDLSALDEDTAWRLGVFVDEQVAAAEAQRDQARRVIERVLERHRRLGTLCPADAADLVGAAQLWRAPTPRPAGGRP